MGKKETDDIEKNNIIRYYLDIAKKYKPDINIQSQITQQTEKIICSECNNKKEFHEIDNEFICLVCGNTLETTTRFSSYKDVERVNMTTKYTYDRKVHFRDCINQFQGKQNATIDETVYTDLTTQFELHGLLIGKHDTNKEERFKNITKHHIYLFLKETNHTKHYEDAILIHYNLTGNKSS